MGLDWRTVDLAEYLEALEAHNSAHSPDSEGRPEPSEQERERLARVVAAHNNGRAGKSVAVSDLGKLG